MPPLPPSVWVFITVAGVGALVLGVLTATGIRLLTAIRPEVELASDSGRRASALRLVRIGLWLFGAFVGLGLVLAVLVAALA